MVEGERSGLPEGDWEVERVRAAAPPPRETISLLSGCVGLPVKWNGSLPCGFLQGCVNAVGRMAAPIGLASSGDLSGLEGTTQRSVPRQDRGWDRYSDEGCSY